MIEVKVVGCPLFKGVSSSLSGGNSAHVCYKSAIVDSVVETEVSI
jgi:hypothetical protein